MRIGGVGGRFSAQNLKGKGNVKKKNKIKNKK